MTKPDFTFSDWLKIPDYDTPEGIQPGQLIFDPDKCKQCGICVGICPGGCIRTDTTTKIDIMTGRAKGGKYGLPHLETTLRGTTLCIACYDCGAACPHDAITIKTNFNPKFFLKRLTQTSDMRFPKPY
ncbi:MAG: 4Fe-4S binding protein [Thermodesulfobacteriota bacterium]|nr:4Fe-4S binding protein [Thermodesulfobacteriota bacterium]